MDKVKNEATESPFTGKYWQTKTKGLYRCASCGVELFSSETKFDSSTGWPSFTEPVNRQSVTLRADTSQGLARTEVACARCGAHLGHVFDDGPKALPNGQLATGKRYCINSVCLEFGFQNR